MTLSEALEGYVREMEGRGFSRKTVDIRRYQIEKFLSYIRKTSGAGKLDEIRGSEVSGFFTYLLGVSNERKKDKKLSEATISGIRVALRELFLYAERQAAALGEPGPGLAAHVPVYQPVRPLPKKILSEEEVRRILSALDLGNVSGQRDRTLIELLYGTGMRLGEALNLKLSDVDFRSELVYVRQGKGRKDRVIPLAEGLVKLLEGYTMKVRPNLAAGGGNGEDRFFLNRRGNALSLMFAGKMLRSLGKRLGFEFSLHAHLFRHALSVHLMRRGCDVRYIQALLGHERIATTEVYTRIDDGDLREKIERFHFWAEGNIVGGSDGQGL